MSEGTKATPEQQAELDRVIAEHAAEYRARNERVFAARKLVADRRAAFERTPGTEKWHAKKLLDDALDALARVR